MINQIIRYKHRSTAVLKSSALALVLLCLSGCNLLFPPEEVEFAILETTSDYENVIKGVYGLLTVTMCDADLFYINVKGDDLYNISADYNVFFNDPVDKCWTYDYSTENYTTDKTWINLYTIIVSINNLLVQYAERKIENDEINKIAGEAYLLRAYCYFRLTRTYGQIPLVEDIRVDYAIAKSSFIEIYEFIENDLLLAQQLLPENIGTARVPYITPHKGVAKSILAELYLSWAGYPCSDATKYQLAATTAKEVIDNQESYGIGLLGDFADIWKRSNLYNKESVFGIYFIQPSAEHGYNYLYRSWSFINSSFDYIDGFWTTEAKYYNTYPKNYRRDITFLNDVHKHLYSYDTILTEEIVYKYIDELEPKCQNLKYRKFFFDTIQMTFTDEYSSREYIFGNQRLDLFRFAHTLLTYAEASARSGNLNAKAYECVNMIRRRANHLDIHTPSEFDLKQGLSPEVFADSVVWERAWELAGEPEGRWFDLVRLEMVENSASLRYPGTGDFLGNLNISKKDYYFSIPESEIILNPKLGE